MAKTVRDVKRLMRKRQQFKISRGFGEAESRDCRYNARQLFGFTVLKPESGDVGNYQHI